MSSGTCQCGCGKPTTVATKSNARYGWVKGEPYPFARGHRRATTPLAAALDRRTDKSGECWIWTGEILNGGYGRLHHGRRRILAHRASYEVASGSPVPAGVEVDHTCFNNACVNPAHLELVTRAENMRRAIAAGVGAAGVNARKTHCPHGHEYTVENTRMTEGRRRCRTCLRAAARRARSAAHSGK